jgi:hypothetical protein
MNMETRQNRAGKPLGPCTEPRTGSSMHQAHRSKQLGSTHSLFLFLFVNITHTVSQCNQAYCRAELEGLPTYLFDG